LSHHSIQLNVVKYPDDYRIELIELR